MFATFTDWSVDDPREFAENANQIWPSIKEAGALNMRIVQTDEKSARTMTIWPDAETAQIAIEAISAVSFSQTGVKAVGGARGALITEFD